LLAKKEAIVTRLSAIEELAGVDVLCSDKTGTLTQNKLTLGDPFTVDGIAPDKVILWAALASRAEDKDTIDLAVIGGVKDDKELKSLQGAALHAVRSGTQTHRSHRQRRGREAVLCGQGRSAGNSQDGDKRRRSQGAVEKTILEFAGRGFRSLGVARADEQGKWKFVGMLPLVRSAARAGQSNHRKRRPNGRKDQDGYGRSDCHRP
jgi:H+-transporting ATPase